MYEILNYYEFTTYYTTFDNNIAYRAAFFAS